MMNKLRRRHMARVIYRLCTQHRMRPQFKTATLPIRDGFRPQVCLEIMDYQTEIPYARIYLSPAKMRAFLNWGLSVVDEYEKELADE